MRVSLRYRAARACQRAGQLDDSDHHVRHQPHLGGVDPPVEPTGSEPRERLRQPRDPAGRVAEIVFIDQLVQGCTTAGRTGDSISATVAASTSGAAPSHFMLRRACSRSKVGTARSISLTAPATRSFNNIGLPGDRFTGLLRALRTVWADRLGQTALWLVC